MESKLLVSSSLIISTCAIKAAETTRKSLQTWTGARSFYCSYTHGLISSTRNPRGGPADSGGLSARRTCSRARRLGYHQGEIGQMIFDGPGVSYSRCRRLFLRGSDASLMTFVTDR